MGGKTKLSQRTKNNVRPSSSARSAGLLSNIKLETSLVAAGGVRTLPPPSLTHIPITYDPLLTPEIGVCIKKINKKDPITKTKALQELTELVNKSDLEDVVVLLYSWVHYYMILTADPDRKVREMTQVCHGAIVKVSGRRIAPFLKHLMPSWLQAQQDDHAPAQTQAQKSLTSTFSDSKLPEVISFCKAEVITHLRDILTGNTDLANSKRCDTGPEVELQQTRQVVSCQQGLEYFLAHLPSQHDDWLWEELESLLQSNAFWKRATHTDYQVRATWFAAMGRIIERYKETFGEKYGVQIMRILLGSGVKQSSLSAPQSWSCLLLLMHNVKGWHTYLDKKELLSKRILDVLLNGGWGDAKHLSNMLLPLLAYLPEEMLTKNFYEAFFTAIFTGLEKSNILSSKSERQSWITGLADCLRFISVQQQDFVVEVATSVHRTWIERVLFANHESTLRCNLIKFSATSMVVLVKYWLKQSKEENNEKYDQLVRNFWQNVGSTVLIQIEKLSTDHDVIAQLIEGHTLLLQTLKTSFSQEAKKQQSIKFVDDCETVAETTKVVIQQCDASITERFKHNLEELVQKICCNYFEFADKKQVSNAVLTQLITLLTEFDSENLFMALATHFDVDTVYKFYEKVLRLWLSGDTMRCKAVVDVTFLVLKHLSEEQQDSLFESFKQFPPSVIEWCISLSLSHPHRSVGAVRRWMGGRLVAESVTHVTRRVVSTGDARAKNLLLMCLAHDEDGEMIISSEAASSIVEVFSAALGDVSCSTLEPTAALAAQLATALADRAHDHHYAALVRALFRLNVLVPRGDGRVCVATWCEVRSSWQDGAAALPAAARAALLDHAAAVLHQHLFHQVNDLDINKIEHAVSLCPYLLNGSDDFRLPEDITEIVSFTKRLFDLERTNPLAVEVFALRHDCVKANLNCPFDDGDIITRAIIEESSNTDVEDLSKENLTTHLNKYLFRAIYLRTILLHKTADDEEADQKSWCSVLLGDKYLEMELCNILYDYAVICSLYDGYAFWPHYKLIQQSKQKLDTLVQDIIYETPLQLKTQILSTLSELTASKGYYWAFARRYYEVQAKLEIKLDAVELDINKMTDALTGNGVFHALQANTKYSEDEEPSIRAKYLVMLRSFYVAHAQEAKVIDEQFARDVTQCQAECNIDVIVNAYYRHNHTMLYERDISDAPWSQIVSNASIAEYLCAWLSRGWTAPAHHWDFAAITLCSLLNSVEKSKNNWGSTKVSLVARAVLNLYAAMQQFIAAVPGECTRRTPLAHVAHLPTEWKDIFAPDLHSSLFSLIIFVLETSPKTTITCSHVAVMDALMCATRHMSWASLPAAQRVKPYPLQRVVSVAAHAATLATHHAYKYLAHCLLRTIAEPLVLEDAEKLSAWSESASETDTERPRPHFSLEYYNDAFTRLQDLVDAALEHVKLCEETCELVPFTDVYSVTLGWLLLADALAEQCQLARGELTHHYIQIYRDQQFGEPVLKAALRLLPARVFAAARDFTADSPPPQVGEIFLRVPDFSVYKAASSGDIGELACRSMYTCVCGAGSGSARGWRGAAGAARARLLDRLVGAHVTPHAVRAQLLHVQRGAADLQDAEVTIHWSTNEVACVYTVEDRPLELRVWLARDHPLSLPRLAAPAHLAAAANTHWIAVYLAYQNGTLLNAFKMWISAVSAQVAHAPQCYICYCRLHPASGHLPRVYCHQCRNKFHNSCLRKWFATSNKSNCPLCRGTF